MLTTTELARRLATYIPVTLTKQILDHGLPIPGKPRLLAAAALFSDISGFTSMSEELASDGPRGAEELNRVLLKTFTGMIDVVHEMGGAVSHFYGDAMSIYFPDLDGRAAQRALVCGQKMQQLMLTDFGQVVTNRPPGKNPIFDLTIKIGVGYGACQELVVGTPDTSLEFVLAGEAVDEAAASEKHAEAGQVVASLAVMDRVGMATGADFTIVRDQVQVLNAGPILDWTAYSEEALERLATTITPFVAPALYERLTAVTLENLAEHRPVTSIFVQFDYTGDETHASTIDTDEKGEQLQHYYEWVSQMVTRFGVRNARLNRVLTGDKGNQLHIMFGAPVAPDAPDQALRCALALQREHPPFITRQRIGLATGKVFAGPVGGNLRREYTVVGDVVNLSARLTQICEGGKVITDETTAGRVRDLIEFVDLLPVKLKGKQAKLTPYSAQRERSRTRQLQTYLGVWDKPLVGRAHELDLLLGGMDAALRGLGGVAALYGSTGSGKTRLVAAGVKYWMEKSGLGFVGECQQHTSDIPFGPWRTVWRDLFDLRPDMDISAQAVAVVDQTRALVPDCGDDVGLWGEVLGLPIPQAESLLELTAEARQRRFLDLATKCFQAVAVRQPLLIILEGLHWADQPTLKMIDDLSSHLEAHAIFMALAFRPITELPLEALARSVCIPIVVSDLPSQDARKLLKHLVGTSKLPPIVEQHLGIRDREGRESPVNPLYLEESLNVMMGMGILQLNGRGRNTGRLRVDENLLAQMQVPDTIHGLLLARLDRLPAGSRDLLQVASIIGREFALQILDTITPVTPYQVVADRMIELVDASMTRLIASDPEWVYLFQHAMTHEVAYESLPFARRQVLHADVADSLLKQHSDNLKPYYPVLAYHYSQANMPENGLRYALFAADDARDIFANKEAVDLYNLAERHLEVLGEAQHWETAVDLFLSRGEVLRFTGDFAAAISDAERALTLSETHQDARRAIKGINLLADFKYRQSRFGEVKALAERVITRGTDAVPPDDLALAYQWHGLASAEMLDTELALTSLNYAEEICITTEDNKRLARVLEGIAYVHFSQGDLEPALQAMQRSVALSRNFSTSLNVAFALNNIGALQLALGRPFDALDTYDETIELARSTSQNLLVFALGNRAETYSYVGRYAEASADFEEADDLLSDMDDEYGQIVTSLLWGYEYYSAQGEWEDARAHFERVEQLIGPHPDNYPEERARFLVGMGQVELCTNGVERAGILLDEAEKIIEDKDLSWWRPIIAYYIGLVRLTEQNNDEARAYFEAGVTAVEERGCPDYLPLHLLQLAKLETNSDKKKEHLKACVQATLIRARYVDKIFCLEEAGKMLRQSQDPVLHELGRECIRQLQRVSR